MMRERERETVSEQDFFFVTGATSARILLIFASRVYKNAYI